MCFSLWLDDCIWFFMCCYKEDGSGIESEDVICLVFYNSVFVVGFEIWGYFLKCY